MLLKELLTKRYDPDYAVLIVQGWEDAILRKVVQAVPIEGDTFELEYRALQGPKRKLKVQNEVVIFTPTTEAWMSEQVEKARLEIMKNTGNINVTESAARDLSSLNLQDLAQLAELRTQHVAEKRKRKK